MGSESGSVGLPGGFPSMPGFGGAAATDGDLRGRLEELTERHRAGAISDAEFECEKARLLAEG